MRPEMRDLLREFQKRIPEPVRLHIRRLILFGSAAREKDQLGSKVAESLLFVGFGNEGVGL